MVLMGILKVKKLIFIVLTLTVLQLGRIALKNIVFSFMTRTLLSDVIVSIIYMSLIICIALVIMKKKRIDISIFPQKWNVKYTIFTLLVFGFLIVTPVITKSYQLYDILSLIYNAIVTVIFEELIFRGFVFKEISSMKNDLVAYIISTILFGIWHLGYIDTILWRTSLFSPEANIANIMFWKVITGMIIGIVLGFFRYKNKNTYSSILVHTFINTFGS